MKHTRFVFILLLLAGLQLAAALPVAACTATPDMPTLEAIVDAADMVLVGTVAGHDGNAYGKHTILVESYLKGDGPTSVAVTGFGTGAGDCRSVIAIGDRLLFFVDGNSATDDVLRASYAGASGAIRAATDENIAAVSAITRQIPTPGYALPQPTPVQSGGYPPTFKIAVLAGIPLLVIAGGLVIASLSKRRKAKPKNQA